MDPEPIYSLKIFVMFLVRFTAIAILLCGLFISVPGQKKARPVSIKSLDFRNRVYNTGAETVRLKKGRFVTNGARYYLESVKYQDFNRDKAPEAVVTMRKETEGKVGEYRIYLIYNYSKGRVGFLFGQIRPRGEPIRLNKDGFTLSGSYWAKKDRDCCPTRKEIEKFQWNSRKRQFVKNTKQSKVVKA